MRCVVMPPPNKKTDNGSKESLYFRFLEMSDEKYDRDATLVERELKTLKERFDGECFQTINPA